MNTATYLPVAQAGVPLLLWGAPGSGKSAMVHHWTRGRHMHCETLIGSLSDSGDVIGFAVQDGGSVRFALPEWFTRLGSSGSAGVLFLDEINRGTRAVRSAMLRIIAERSIHGHTLPEHVAVVGAANDDGDVDDMDGAMLSRFCHLAHQPDALSWVRQTRGGDWDLPGTLPQTWKDHLPVHAEMVCQFVAARPELLHKVSGRTDLRGSTCPRTWTMLARGLAACASLSIEPAPIVVGLVGDGAAKEYRAWAKQLDIPPPEQVLAGKWKPGQRDQQRAALLSIVPLIRTPDTWDAAWEQVARCHKDVAVLAARHIAPRRPAGSATPLSAAVLIDVLR